MRLAFLPLMLLIVPIVEIGAFIAIGGQIGIGLTLLMILVTAVIGTYFLRVQGLGLLNQIQQETAAGKIPGKALGHGAMILVAGILLLTPGFVTDSIGFCLFVPPVRSAIRNFVSSRIQVVTPMGPLGANMNDPFSDQTSSGPDHHGPTIDLDAEDFASGKPDKNSPWSSNSPK